VKLKARAVFEYRRLLVRGTTGRFREVILIMRDFSHFLKNTLHFQKTDFF